MSSRRDVDGTYGTLPPTSLPAAAPPSPFDASYPPKLWYLVSREKQPRSTAMQQLTPFSPALHSPARRANRIKISKPQARKAARQRQPLPGPVPVRRNRGAAGALGRGAGRRRPGQPARERGGGVGDRGGREETRKVPAVLVGPADVLVPVVAARGQERRGCLRPWRGGRLAHRGGRRRRR